MGLHSASHAGRPASSHDVPGSVLSALVPAGTAAGTAAGIARS